jgi:hypothetical protein
MRDPHRSVIAIALVMLVACGKSHAEKQADEGAEQAEKAAPISFEQLQTALPTMRGWQMEKPRGERMALPVPFSQTEATYTKGDAQVEVKIVDSAFSSLLVAPWATFLTTGYEKRTSDGYEKSVNVGGNPGFEKWNSEEQDGELNLVVAKRFLVTIAGNGIGDVKVLHEFASKLDTKKLATLK